MDEEIKQIKMILMDVDGVLTDGKISFTSSGREIKSFDIQDGMGITLARKAGLKTGIITGRTSTIVERRAAELHMDVIFQGAEEKTESYQKIKKQFELSDEQICYIADDLPDILVLKQVGFSVAVQNARKEVKDICSFITQNSGGNGAVRETIELILKKQNLFLQVLEDNYS